MGAPGDDDGRICEPGQKGFLLPLIQDEQHWNRPFRAVLYSLGLIYCFLGVSIVADTFMSAIEAITSRRKQVSMASGRVITLRVWNGTISNLTLMALGSSAPEILLSTIELFKRGMFAGDLGPSTIIGSAAFNLMMIVGFCIVIIPSPEIRTIKEMPVFIVTAFFSLFAYGLIVVVLISITPDVVDASEALVTLLCFPLLVVVAYLADIGVFGNIMRIAASKVRWAGESDVPDAAVMRICDLVGSHIASTETAARKGLFAHPDLLNIIDNPSDLDLIRLKTIVSDHVRMSSMSRAARRIDATRHLSKGRKLMSCRGSDCEKERSYYGAICMPESLACLPGASNKGSSVSGSNSVGSVSCDRVEVQFVSRSQCLSLELEEKPMLLVRVGDQSVKLTVEYTIHCAETSPKRSLSMEEYVVGSGRWQSNVAKSCGLGHTTSTSSGVSLGPQVDSGTIIISADQKLTLFRVRCPGGLGVAGDFRVCLGNVRAEEGSQAGFTGPGPLSAARVKVCSRGSAGVIGFACERLVVLGTSEKQPLWVVVRRRGGCSKHVRCRYHTEPLNSVPGFHYVESDGYVEFPEGVTEQVIALEILPKTKNESSDEFLVVLDNVTGGAEFDPSDDGGLESSILTVSIKATGNSNKPLGLITRIETKVNFDQIRLGNEHWHEQFVGALYCNGSSDEQHSATAIDWIFHIVSLPWKIFFAFVPPTSYFGGWVCFCVSLIFIAVVTAVIGDFAELFGCVVDVPDSVTALTFVALGTSMPDLFASKSAALHDPYADASICNVTGSNSVNVFLGLGLPWTIAAIYWQIRGRTDKWESKYKDVADRLGGDGVGFVVPSDGLGFTVVIYFIVAVIAIGLLCLRRKFIGGELGGPRVPKFLSAAAFVTMWALFIFVSSWQLVRGDKSGTAEQASILAVSGAVALAPVLALVVSLVTSKPTPPDLSLRQDTIDISGGVTASLDMEAPHAQYASVGTSADADDGSDAAFIDGTVERGGLMERVNSGEKATVCDERKPLATNHRLLRLRPALSVDSDDDGEGMAVPSEARQHLCPKADPAPPLLAGAVAAESPRLCRCLCELQAGYVLHEADPRTAGG